MERENLEVESDLLRAENESQSNTGENNTESRTDENNYVQSKLCIETEELCKIDSNSSTTSVENSIHLHDSLQTHVSLT